MRTRLRWTTGHSVGHHLQRLPFDLSVVGILGLILSGIAGCIRIQKRSCLAHVEKALWIQSHNQRLLPSPWSLHWASLALVCHNLPENFFWTGEDPSNPSRLYWPHGMWDRTGLHANNHSSLWTVSMVTQVSYHPWAMGNAATFQSHSEVSAQTTWAPWNEQL